MIIIRMSGGLGNQMFQYALYLKLKSLGRDVSIDDTTEYEAARQGADIEGNRRPLMLGIFGIDYPKAKKEDVIRLTDADMAFLQRVKRKLHGRHSLEKHDEDFIFDPSFLEAQEGYFTGCFQSPRYFAGIEETVRKAYTFPSGIAEGSESAFFERRIRKEKRTCAVHLRFGDYLQKKDVYGGICTQEYYEEAVREEIHACPSVTFFVFSNDAVRARNWVRKRRHPERFVCVSGNDEDHGYLDLYLMSLCDDFIIANSSFSFWGAWLGKTQGKRVYAPAFWIHEKDGSELRRSDIYTEDMIRISPQGKRADMPLVSVIVPCYNIAPYVRDAIDSLLAQTLKKLEIIAVDDGSADGTGQILDDYAKKDHRVVVIHKKNGGLSDARNAGLDAAKGEYIGFLDGDDTAEPCMFESMLDACVLSGADMSLCGYREVKSEDRENKEESLSDPSAILRKSTVLTRQQALDIYVRSGVVDEEGGINFYNSVWSKLFSREVIHGAYFPVGRNSEDILYTTKAILRSGKLVYLDAPLYRYVLDREGSIMNQKTGERRLNDEIPFYFEQIHLFEVGRNQDLARKAKFYLARRLLFYYEDFRNTPGMERYAEAVRKIMLDHREELLQIMAGDAYGRSGDRARLVSFLKSPERYEKLSHLYEKTVIRVKRRHR